MSIANLALVERHAVSEVYDTVSHTVHFVGGGVLSYLHMRSGRGVELHGWNIQFLTQTDGGISVLGTTEPDSQQ